MDEIHSFDLLHIKSYRRNYTLTSTPKELHYFTNYKKSFFVYSAQTQKDSKFTINCISETTQDYYKATFQREIKKKDKRTLMSTMQVIALSDLSDSLISKDLVLLKKGKLIQFGHPIFLRNLMNGSFLGVLKSNPNKIHFSNILDDSSEFLFFFEPLEEDCSSVKFSKRCFIRSILGGELSFNCNSLDKMNENNNNSLRETTLQYSKIQSILHSMKVQKSAYDLCISTDFENRQRSVMTIEVGDSELLLFFHILRGLVNELIDYYQYFQNWGLVLGIKLQRISKESDENKVTITRENLYFSYEVFSNR